MERIRKVSKIIMYVGFALVSALAIFSMVYTFKTRKAVRLPSEIESTVVITSVVEVERNHPLLVSGEMITSDFGERYDGFHIGLDVASRKHDQILPYADGSILETGYSHIFGNWVKMWHTPWLITKYCHLSTNYWKAGRVLTKYEPLGRTGETGMALGDHLHFEMLLFIEGEWVNVDPALFLHMSRDDMNYRDFLMIWNEHKDKY